MWGDDSDSDDDDELGKKGGWQTMDRLAGETDADFSARKCAHAPHTPSTSPPPNKHLSPTFHSKKRFKQNF